MSEPFVGEIRCFGFQFAPRGWAHCHGQLLAISQNEALFSLLGTTYGGDGRTTFGLPDLRGRVALGHGRAPGLADYRMGVPGGQETVALTQDELPSHRHGVAATAKRGRARTPAGRFLAKVTGGRAYRPTSDVVMHEEMITETGGDLPHANLQPYLPLNYSIALVGIFPSRS